MFRQCAPPTVLSKPSLRVRENAFFNQGCSVLQSVAFAGPPGPAFFFFCLSPSFSQPPLSEWRRTGFLSPWVGHCPRIRSQLGHTPPTGLVWGLGGVASLPRPLTGQKPPHRAEFGFSPQNEFTPPPKGGGAGYCFSLVVRVLLGSCLWQLLATTAPHGFNRACLEHRWCRFPTQLSKPHTGPHGA